MTIKHLNHLVNITLEKNESDVGAYDKALIHLYEREHKLSHRGSLKTRISIIKKQINIVDIVCEIFAYISFLGWFLYVLNGYFGGY